MIHTENPPKVAIVILNYNGMKNDYLKRFLPSVYDSIYANLALYVIDNKSTDNSVAYLKSEGFSAPNDAGQERACPRFLIELDQNYWFAGGYNIGLKQVQADYYILLNSDVEVAPNWIQPIIDLMESDTQIAACQPKIKLESEKYFFEHAGAAGGWIDKWGYPFCRGRLFNKLEEDKGQYNNTQEVFWATGAAMFVRAQLFHDFGGFDADYKAHMEEIDLCWRFKRANYKIMACPASEVWHVGGGTLPKSNPLKTFLNFKNSLTTIFKNETSDKVYKIILIRLLLDAVAGVRFLMNGEWSNIGAIVKAHWSFFGDYKQNKKKRLELAELVEKQAYNQQPNFRNTGVYPHSVVWQHFVKGKQTYNDLELK